MKCVPVHHGIPAVLHRDEPWLHRHSENGALANVIHCCVFLTGRSLWRFTGYKLDQGYPKRFNKTIMPYKPTAAYIHKNQFADYQLYLFAVSLLFSLTRE